MADLYLALLHHPVYDKNGAVVTTAVTNLDVHDLGRLARTYDVRAFYVATPVPTLRRLVERIMRHWDTGPGAAYNHTRKEALALARLSTDLDAVIADIEREAGVLPRLIALPRTHDEPWTYIYLAALIKHNIADLFPGLILDGIHAFRVTRNSDLYIDEEEAENLLRTIEQELRRSSRGNAVRLEVEADCPKEFLELLLEFFDLGEERKGNFERKFKDPDGVIFDISEKGWLK